MFALLSSPDFAPVFRTFGKNHDNMMGVEEFVAGMSLFLRGSLDDQIKCEISPFDHHPLSSCYRLLRCLRPEQRRPHRSRGNVYAAETNDGQGWSALSVLRQAMTHPSQASAEEDRDEGIKDLVDLVLKKMVSAH